MPLSPGDVIADKYRVERLLGEGRMGRVYVATHGVLRKQVALKVMVERFRVSPDMVERFFREAVAATKVDHPAIVQVFDAGVHGDKPFMAMELLQGEDLDQRLKREGRLTAEETLLMARPILSALEAAHRAGVVHRDIKPPNIFLARRPDGVVTPKLLDFGIAKHINDPFFDKLTASGSVLGTPMYIAPEQVENERDVDHRADIYSIGVTLFHCLSGTTPFEAASFPELIGKMFSEEPRDLAMLAPHVPPSICAWVQRSISRDPDARPQTAQELLDGLSGARGPELEGEEDEEKKTVAMEWGSERSAPLAHPPTRAIPVSSPAPAVSPVAEESGSDAAWRRPTTSAKRRPGRGLLFVGIAAVVTVGALALAGLWLTTRPPDAGAAISAVPRAPVVDPREAPEALAAEPLDAGAPMEPSAAPEQTPGQEAPPPAAEGRAQLQVEADSPGECFIDGDPVGRTPVTRWVSAGPHRVSVVYGPMHHLTEDVELRAGEHRVVRLGATDEEPSD